MTTSMRTMLVCAALAGLGVAACGGGEEAPVDERPTDGTEGGETVVDVERVTETPQTPPPTPPPPPAPARVRVVHASPDPATASVSVYLDGGSTPAIAGLAYRAVAGYAELPPGAHTVAVRPATAPADSPAALEGSTPELASGAGYTVIAHGLASGVPALALAAAADDGPAPEAGHAHVRFFHALVGAAAADICLPGANARAAGTPVFANVAYGTFGAASGEGAHGTFANVPTGAEVRLQIRAANAARPCTGASLGTVAFTPTEGVWTAVAVGRTTGRPAVAKELLLMMDGSADVTAVAIR
jgi:hypothetical protein